MKDLKTLEKEMKDLEDILSRTRIESDKAVIVDRIAKVKGEISSLSIKHQEKKIIDTSENAEKISDVENDSNIKRKDIKRGQVMNSSSAGTISVPLN